MCFVCKEIKTLIIIQNGVQDRVKIGYKDSCMERSETIFATFVDAGLITVSAAKEGVAIGAGARSMVTITVLDADLDTDPFSVQVFVFFEFYETLRVLLVLFDVLWAS
jgi:hypothetical protein